MSDVSLSSMKRLTWDTETALFGPGRMAPPLSCVAWMQEGVGGLLDHEECKEWFIERLKDPECLHVGHHIAYDMAVLSAEHPELLPLIFKAYRENRVTDTMLRQMLLDNAIGRFGGRWVEQYNAKHEREDKFIKIFYSLDDCYFRATKKRLDKDSWRKKYGGLRGVPIHAWPDGARRYPLDDVRATDAVYVWQDHLNKQIIDGYTSIDAGHVEEPEPLADQFAQARAAFWIQLMSVWGIRTNPDRVDEVEVFVIAELDKIRGTLKESGLVRADGTRNLDAASQRMVSAMNGEGNCKKTKTGRVQLTEEACRESGDPLLIDYAELTSLSNVLSKDIPALRQGKILPIHSSFRSLVATGRTSSSSPNIQNIRRLAGIRECFVPRPGKVFLDCDYDCLELRTLAQTCLTLLGKSRLAEIINEGQDPHLMFAAELMHISYQEAKERKEDADVQEMRQLAKAANFGFPGGLGIETFIKFAQGYKVFLTEEEARVLKNNWFKAFPEMEDYFALISKYTKEDKDEGFAHIEQLFTKRLRGETTYTAACNSYFQGLGADATKAAGFQIAYECYVDKTSPLFGCRIVNYIHDQFLVECDEDRAHEAAFRLARVMEEYANPFLPDVPAKVGSPMVTRCWSKDTKQVWDRPRKRDDGTIDINARLIPWDKEFEVKKKKKAA